MTASPAIAFERALLSLLKVSICEYVEANERPDTDSDSMVASRPTCKETEIEGC